MVRRSLSEPNRSIGLVYSLTIIAVITFVHYHFPMLDYDEGENRPIKWIIQVNL